MDCMMYNPKCITVDCENKKRVWRLYNIQGLNVSSFSVMYLGLQWVYNLSYVLHILMLISKLQGLVIFKEDPLFWLILERKRLSAYISDRKWDNNGRFSFIYNFLLKKILKFWSKCSSLNSRYNLTSLYVLAS